MVRIRDLIIFMKYNRALLFGRWYRNDVDMNGSEIEEYAELSADGSFEFTFISTQRDTHLKESIVELGDWGLVGEIHFTITKNELIDQELYPADLNDSDNYQAYNVLKLDHQSFEYQHIETKEIFKMRKITDNIGHC